LLDAIFNCFGYSYYHIQRTDDNSILLFPWVVVAALQKFIFSSHI